MSQATGITSVSPARGAAPTIVRVGLGVLEAIAAALVVVEVVLLLLGVVMRYVFHSPLVWVDELTKLLFLYLAMLGAVIASQRHEHLRLTVFTRRSSSQSMVQTLALLVVALFLATMLLPSFEYVQYEWIVSTAVLGIPNGIRYLSVVVGLLLMLCVTGYQIYRLSTLRSIAMSVAVVGLIALGLYLSRGLLVGMGNYNIIIFFVIIVAVCLVIGVPIAFCFGIGTIAFLAFTTHVPLSVIVGRMDEGMSSPILLSIPIFILLGYILDSTGMGKAIVDCLASWFGHVRAGMSYVLLGSLFLVSGISGSKVSDMATVAPALFPEMKRRGHKSSEMIAQLATGAAMADTVPPSIVLIVVGSVVGASIADLFTSGLVVAVVLLVVLLIMARLRSSKEDISGLSRPSWRAVWNTFLIASPALLLPFLIRGAVSEGIATATEVSTLAVVYAVIAGILLYGGLSWRKAYGILVETASLTGAIMLIMGTAQAMAWGLTQTGFAQQLVNVMTELPGGAFTFMVVSVVTFMLMGCLLEGIPAIVLLGPLMFPVAAQFGFDEIHYALVAVISMNIGLMAPPIGIGFYLACSIGKVSPDEALGAIWPYLLTMTVGLAIIAAVPAIATVFI